MGSKAEKRAAAIDTLKTAAKEDDAPVQALAMIDLLKDMLDSLERIAEAAEKIAWPTGRS